MSQISQEVPIDLGERSYRIAIGGGLLADAATYGDLPRASTALIVNADGSRVMVEHSFGPNGGRLGEVRLEQPSP